MKKKKNKEKNVEWKALKPKDRIRILKGSGPYREINGVRHYIGADAGYYTVKKVDENGIHAYDGNGFVFLYMGPPKESITGGILCRYKIKLINI